MKKYLLKSVLVLITVSMLISCGDKKQETTVNNNVFMRYKFVKGDKFRYRLTSYVTSDESVQADSLLHANTKQTDIYVFDFEVLDVDTENIAELNATISSINVNVNDGRQTLTFDPSKAPNKEEQQKFLQYAIQYNSPFHARVNHKGEVIEISRLDKMVEKAISIQSSTQTLTAQQKAAISQDISEGMIHPVVQLIFRELPATAVAKDSTWSKSYPGQLSVFKIQNTASFKLTDFVKVNSENAAKVKVDLTVKFEGEKKGEQNGAKFNFEDPKVSGSGDILFNLDKGLLIKSETITNVELVAHIEGRDNMQRNVKATRKDLSTNKNVIELIPM